MQIECKCFLEGLKLLFWLNNHWQTLEQIQIEGHRVVLFHEFREKETDIRTTIAILEKQDGR